MHPNSKSILRASILAGSPWLMVSLASSGAGAATTYTVANVGAAVVAAGGSVNGNTTVPFSISSNGTVVAGLTAAGNPFIYTPSTGVANVISSISSSQYGTVGINNSGTLVGGYSNGGQANYIYQAGITTTVAATSVSNPNPNAAGGPAFVSFTGVNNTGTVSGYTEYTTTYTGSANNEGIVYNNMTGKAQDVGSGYSNNLPTNVRGNVLYSINDSGEGAGFGAAPSSNTPETLYTATPNGSGGYTYNNLSTSINVALGLTSDAAAPDFVGIDSKGDVAGTLSSPSGDGVLYDGTTGTSYIIGGGYSNVVNGLASVNGVAEVVGDGYVRGPGDLGFIYTEAGGYQLLSSFLGPAATGLTLKAGLAVDSNGDILALGTNSSGVTSDYLFTASVPEPASIGVLGGLGLAALTRRRRSTR